MLLVLTQPHVICDSLAADKASCEEMVTCWLKGGQSPRPALATWDSLIKSLEDSEESSAGLRLINRSLDQNSTDSITQS